jgi:ubiquinone/menaquinone biosynthesis C-methylase UbiE
MRDMFGATRITIDGNFALFSNASRHAKQQQTNEMFSEKWQKYEQSAEKERLYQYQRDWYLRLYGFDIEAAFASYLTSKNVIFDAGCGLGYKAAWFAKLAPHALVLGMDFSEAAKQAAQSYRNIDNLFFIQGDIASTGLRDGVVDYTSCDQVIMHTEDPEKTFAELARITSRSGELACYFYATKAVPRELLDDYFRTRSLSISREALWAMSVQLTELGQRLSALQISIDVPDIPELGIKGGRQDLQRFIYWNFLKCFWSAELGRETSILTNFDWYSPSNAQRFREPEVHALVEANGMVKRFFHTEEACYSGRFAHR